jgi:hypothetical protein
MAVSKANSNKDSDADNKSSEIPKFNLAEQILAEQRKIAAIRRRGPGKRAEAPKQQRKAEPDPILQEDHKTAAQSTGYTTKPPPILSEQEQIIAEIVARDIEKLYGSNISNSV